VGSAAAPDRNHAINKSAHTVFTTHARIPRTLGENKQPNLNFLRGGAAITPTVATCSLQLELKFEA
jgi:hypothetical protein